MLVKKEKIKIFKFGRLTVKDRRCFYCNIYYTKCDIETSILCDELNLLYNFSYVV